MCRSQLFCLRTPSIVLVNALLIGCDIESYQTIGKKSHASNALTKNEGETYESDIFVEVEFHPVINQKLPPKTKLYANEVELCTRISVSA